MPRIKVSSYQAPFGLKNPHYQTIYPTLFRKVPLITNERQRIQTPDQDFLDLDWARPNQGARLAVLTHGLEGHSRGQYMQGMARALTHAGWDVLAWNFRSCGGELNLQLQSYHSGASHELAVVLDHVFATTPYDCVALVGFSLGGNLTLKYIGERSHRIDPRIRAAVTFSVPCDLAESARQLEHWSNRLYMQRFMRSLRAKTREKLQRFPGQIQDHGLDRMRTFAEFDDAYTAPIHGFKDAAHYWRESKCLNVLADIRIPTLLVNAQDDPFLTPSCFPKKAAAQSACFQLETPAHGGHKGFVQFNQSKTYWSEERAVAFLEQSLETRSCARR